MASPRIAVVTFTYEDDREIAFELLESLVRSFQGERFDLFFTDDGSASRVGDQVLGWARERGIGATCLRDEVTQGFRGAVDRTIRLLSAIASRPDRYVVILRIDTDALVIREGLAEALLGACTDPRGLYGVIKFMRPRDRIGLMADLLPVGLKRHSTNGRIERAYGFRRLRPVWWWGAGVQAFAKGFDFGFVEGSCYALGGDVPRELARRGYLGRYRRGRHGLITSEEDIIVTMLCRSAGLPLYELDRQDRTWREVNTIGERVLERAADDCPYVIHGLKPTPEGTAFRAKIRARMPLFRD